ncbi:DNA-directed primase/polymerase protein-like isoform X2 [Corticium candelabrum]|uniref:DNA-directed primase/polymerase protein-like isoform X2 n=1 Tax=Corticium candelabrum TaxID=121492 RepID=UPI002E25BE3B|nr:DNA-directed primase/polymerase protein-like isoform X2 [Corticium candelabrum]
MTARKRRCSETLQKLQEYDKANNRTSTVPAIKRRHLVAPSPWRTFPRQKEALELAYSRPDHHVFSFESPVLGDTGCRRFLATTYLAFYEKYRRTQAEERHFYEVIPEGHACKLYFDIEFNKELNPNCVGGHLVDKLIEFVGHEMVRVFRIEKCSREDVLDLDSSTDKKFSRHLVVNLKNIVFADNNQAGVYTRNRNFRILWSSKHGKSAYLHVAKENQFKTANLEKYRNLWKDGHHECLQRDRQFSLFLSSLVCAVRFDGSCQPRILTFDSSPSKPMARKTTIRLEDSCVLESLSHSPFHSLDSFILSQVSTGGVQGVITKATYFPEGNTLSYDIGKNRWCGNVGRQHKSNHIMIIVDLKQGVYYQKCHDPDCRKINYKSSEFVLPVEINPIQQEQVDSGQHNMDEDFLCDEDLIYAADESALISQPSEHKLLENPFNDITDSQLLQACDINP